VDWSVATDSSPVLTTEVKNQGSCGSCWAFAAIAEIESYFIKKHKLWLDLSEQQMVDCVPAVQPGNAGCGGGYLDSVNFYATQFPIAQEKFYPYTAVQGSCQTARINAGKTFKLKSYVYISDCLALANTVFNLKPVGVCGMIDSQWQNYGSGVVPNCDSPTKLGGHCVLLVGVKIDGTEANRNNKDENYWKIQNSWGTGWGEKGFMRMFRDRTQTTGGVCGFCSAALYSL
jgi:C1A family cysteine protease